MSERRLNLALQGGGAHGAFTWGVLDALLADERVELDGISGASAGAMNAAVLAYGYLRGGREGAREALHGFWHAVSSQGWLAGQWRGPLSLVPPAAEAFSQALGFAAYENVARIVSPYLVNPLNLNPLRPILERTVDFEALRRASPLRLFVAATNVRSGQLRVFHTRELSVEAVLASACLPTVFQAVEIAGEHYWDGGYLGNPPLFPLCYHTDTPDILVVHVNPIRRDALPVTGSAIASRVNEIAFNASLLREFRSMAFVARLIDEGWLADEHRGRLRRMYLHAVRADEALADGGAASKFNLAWPFLTALRDRGRAAGAAWLDRHAGSLGRRSTVDLQAEFLDPHTRLWAAGEAVTADPVRAAP
jgi:NTE family protein